VVVDIASECFSGLRNKEHAKEWILCNYKAMPRTRYFTAQKNGTIIGYALWMEIGGFRKEAVLELEQIAVSPEHRGGGAATILITDSLAEMQKIIESRGGRLKIVEITTGIENHAQKLYKKALGAKPEVVIKNLFRGDEVIMLARF